MSSLYKPPAYHHGEGIYSKYIKRPLDFAVATVGIIVASIPMALIAIIVKITTRGPILFPHARVGRDGKEFILYKFRSTRTDCGITTTHGITPSAELDPSFLTPIGRLLRQTSLDELPQLFNVLRGDMSLVGYRPVIPAETWLNESRERAGVFRTRPGITGLAQINGRDNLSLRPKLNYDKKYAQKITLPTDLKILIKSFGVLFASTPRTDTIQGARAANDGRRVRNANR